MIPDLVHPALLAAAKTKSSSSSGIFWIFLLVIAAAGYFLWLRPQQQRQRKQRAAQSDIKEGDEVVTVGGIVGRVIEMNDDRVHLLTGYHTTAGATEHLPHRMTFVRNAIARKVEPASPDPATNGSGAVEDFSFEHDEDGDYDEDGSIAYDEGVGDGATGMAVGHDLADDDADASAGTTGWAEDGAGGDVTGDPANGTGTSGGGSRRGGRGRRAGGGAKGGTSP